MAKIRIHELAKKLNMNSKDLVARLRQMGYSVKNHMSTIDEKEHTHAILGFPACPLLFQ
jgi:translation initiation factor IF-2